jgi:hypothetical protein
MEDGQNLITQIAIALLWIWALVVVIKSWPRLRGWSRIVSVILLVLSLVGGFGVQIGGFAVGATGVALAVATLVVVVVGRGNINPFR